MPASRQTSWIRRAEVRPPTRPALMLMTLVAPSSIAFRASSPVWIDSSRQIGVSISRCSVA
jgi:hypothetical protein